MRKVNLLPLAVLVVTFISPMAIVIPSIINIEVIGWQPRPWWAIAQLWFLPGFISISGARFTPCWDLLRFANDPDLPSYPIFASSAISDTLTYLTMSLSWLVVGLMLSVNTLVFSRGKSSIRLAFVVTMALLLTEIILPYLLLFNLELWRIAGLIPLPIPSVIAGVSIARNYFHKGSRSLSERSNK